MQTYNISCPFCQQRFDVRNSSDLSSIQVDCPLCSRRFTINFRKHDIKLKQEKIQEQPIPNAIDKEDETEYGELSGLENKPSLMLNGINYPLQMGRNTVGRKSATSSASLQLPIKDPYMSRQNAIIEVGQIMQGKWYVTISSCNKQNLAKVNGQEIKIGDKMVLQPKNVIRLGHTDIIFTLD